MTAAPADPGGRHQRIASRVRRLVADHLGVAIEALCPTLSLREDLAVDSLDLAEMVALLEHAFAITVSDRVLTHVHSYGDLVDSTVGLVMADQS